MYGISQVDSIKVIIEKAQANIIIKVKLYFESLKLYLMIYVI